MRPLAFLTLRRIVNSLKRLPKNPRLLIPVIFIAFVVIMQIVPFIILNNLGGTRHGHSHRHHVAPTGLTSPFDPGMLIAGVKAILVLSLLTAIISALGDGSLFFEPSDVDFLFPTPLARRAVLLFRMIPTYLGLLVAACYFPIILSSTLLTLPGSQPNVNFLTLWPGVLGSYLFLITGTNLAQAGVIFRWDRDSGGSTPEQRKRATTLSLAMIVLVVGACYAALHRQAGAGPGGFEIASAAAFINSRASTIALAPIAWAADLYRVPFDGWSTTALMGLGGLILISSLSFVALFLRERDFYEGATEVSARRVRAVAAIRRGDSGAMLSQMAEEGTLRATLARDLHSFGAGALAVIWRDAIMIVRLPLRSWLPMLFIALFPAFFGEIIGRRSDVGVLFWMVMFCIQMSSLFLASARMMLRRADITKALPIGCVRFLLAEQTMSIVQLTLLGWLSLTLMVLFGGGHGPFLLVAYLVFPTLTTLIIFVQTSFVLLYPQQNDAAQNVAGNILGLFVSALAIIPSFAVGLTMYLLLHSPPYLIGIAAAGTNIFAATGAVLVAAYLWHRFDPSN